MLYTPVNEALALDLVVFKDIFYYLFIINTIVTSTLHDSTCWVSHCTKTHITLIISACTHICLGRLNRGASQTVWLCQEGLGDEWVPGDEGTGSCPSSYRHLPKTLQWVY